MDQHRLYYQYPYIKNFSCTVTDCRESGKGTWLLRLSQTGFYPEGGGQPSDRGTLGEAAVLSVHERGEEIEHETDRPIAPGCRVQGVVDWQYRMDNMQQHTGEHILSGLIHRKFGYDNVGFHMGAQEVTIDFNGLLTKEDLEALENEANALVYENVPLHIWYPSEEERRELHYRSKKELSGLVRIVEIPGGDICACCGTHVERTGEVGIIKIRGMIHYKGGVRISMLCGRRALEDYRMRLEDETGLSVLLSAKLETVPEAVRRLKEENQSQEARIGSLYRELLGLKAQQYPESQEPLAVFEEGLSPLQLRQFATLLYEQGKGGIVGVFSGNGDGGYSYALGSSRFDMRALSRRMNQELSGRGGGSPSMAQGTFQAPREAIETVFLREAGSSPQRKG